MILRVGHLSELRLPVLPLSRGPDPGCRQC
jgi:hypothetical protein